jgi:hypothetical protein
MQLDVSRPTTHRLEEAVSFFDQYGYLPLTGLPPAIPAAFEQTLADAAGLTRDEFQPLLDPQAAAIFPARRRQQLSRIATPAALGEQLLASLAPVIRTLIGPIVHVSSTFHAQFKGGIVTDIEHYHNETAADYMEVHGAYRLHQDFTGASLPTSPSGLTLWVPLNTCAESTLRLFPGSHRLGMFCHRMWRLDDPRIPELGISPIDLEAEVGAGVLFNALLFHGTGKTGALRRVSCDIRFFPLCGFLPSAVHMLDSRPLYRLEKRRADALGPTVLAPILEQLLYLGQDVAVDDPAPLSPLNWAKYIQQRLNGHDDAALPYLRRLVNRELLHDEDDVFVKKFHSRALLADRLGAIRNDVERLHGNPRPLSLETQYLG